ncbi:unnamed protein product [Miscanthus lutarioriparius]|uniref:Uncharacterized protein n=1 Tax=Miscanthus lutarioriparius TaxID=422564 RepID=A0A811S6N4_9POAL|nr:unnamed protein product [Miscanthus lutarioriparius]
MRTCTGHGGLVDCDRERHDREGGLDLTAAAPPGPDVHDGRGGQGRGTGIASTSSADQETAPPISPRRACTPVLTSRIVTFGTRAIDRGSMARPGSTLSVATIVELEAKMDRMLRMMEEVNAGMCSTLKTLASATRSSAPSTPTAAPAVATPPSTPALTAAPTPIAATTPSAIDECVVTPTACNKHVVASHIMIGAPQFSPTTTTPPDVIDNCSVLFSACSEHAAASSTSPAYMAPTTSPTEPTAAPTSRPTPTALTIASTPIPKLNLPGAEDNPTVALSTRCSTDRFCRDTNMLMPGSSDTTIVCTTRSKGISMFGICSNVPEVLEVIEKVTGQTSEIELKPWPNWHGHQGSLIVALVCPHSSIVIWVQFSCAVHKLLVWPLHCESWWECCADCLQLLVSAGQVDSIKMEAIGLIQLHIAIPVTELYCLLFTCYHQPVHWKPPWLSLVYIISNIPYIAYSLRIRTPPLKNINSLLTDTCVLCSQSWQPFSNGQLDVLLRQPWPPPLLFDLMGSDGPLKPTPWPSFCESAAALHLQNSSALVLAISLTAVQTSSVWQEVSGKALDFINLLPTLCSHTGQGLYQLKIVISYKHSHELLFSLSQYASLLLHSSQWCFGQLWKPPWPCQVPRWQQKCDGTIKWNDFLLLDGDLIITWSTTEERRAANFFQQHDEVGDSSGLLVSGIFSANKISGIDKVTTIAQKEGLKTALLDHFLAPVAQLLKAEGIGMGNDGHEKFRHRQFKEMFFLWGHKGSRGAGAKSGHIIDVYIKLLKAHEGLIKRPGGIVYLESACITALITWMEKMMRPLKPIILTVVLPSVLG